MKIEAIHPQLRERYRRLPPIPFENPVFRALFKPLLQLAITTKAVAGIEISDHKLTHTKVRVYRPNAPCGAGLLWIHGGGMLIGSIPMNDKECSLFASMLNLTVISVEYRLPPKYTFPCAADDCFEGWRWIQDNAQALGIDSTRIAVSGQSAGGGLAASLVQRIHDCGGIQPAAQALFCPMLDDRTAAKQELDAIKHRLWSNKNNRGGWSSYLGHAVGAARVPEYAVPARRENLSGLPTTWMGIGDIDLFYLENCDYAQRLKDAGVNCEFKVVPMAPHGFEVLVPDSAISKAYFESSYQFLREALAL